MFEHKVFPVLTNIASKYHLVDFAVLFFVFRYAYYSCGGLEAAKKLTCQLCKSFQEGGFAKIAVDRGIEMKGYFANVKAGFLQGYTSF